MLRNRKGQSMTTFGIVALFIVSVLVYHIVMISRTAMTQSRIEDAVTGILSQYYSQHVEFNENTGDFTAEISAADELNMLEDITDAVKKVCNQKLYEGEHAPPQCSLVSVRYVNFEELKKAGAHANCGLQSQYVISYSYPSLLASVYRSGYRIPTGNKVNEYGTKWCSQYNGYYMIPHAKDHPLTILVQVKTTRLAIFLPEGQAIVYAFVGVRPEEGK